MSKYQVQIGTYFVETLYVEASNKKEAETLALADAQHPDGDQEILEVEKV